MSADDDLDPLLDAWLQRDVPPLAPPPGAFKQVSKRARRRKMGKLIVTASSAAAVAAAAVFAVPVISSLRLSPSNSNAVAEGQSSTPAPAPTTPPPTPSAASTRAAAATPTATGSVAQNGVSSILPPSFQPASATFVSASHGWVLGHSTSVGGNCGTGTCVSIVQTADNGHTWTKSGAPPVRFYGTGTGTSASTGVSSLRYFNGRDGWAYGPDLWSTHDGGQSWTQVSTGGQVVVDVEASTGEAFAIFASCHAPNVTAPAISEYGQVCTSFTLESTPAGADSWTPVGPATTGLSYSSTTPTLLISPSIVFGYSAGTGWLLGPDGQVYSGSLTGGAWSRASTSPCPPPVATQPMSPSLLYWESGSTLLYACGTTLVNKGYTDFFLSADSGKTWHLLANSPTPEGFNSVAYSPTVSIILASQAGLYMRPTSTGQWQHFAGPPDGFSWVGTTSTTQGIAIPATATGKIWMTYDGGLTWQPFTVGS
jgi:hypothetical protein